MLFNADFHYISKNESFLFIWMTEIKQIIYTNDANTCVCCMHGFIKNIFNKNLFKLIIVIILRTTQTHKNCLALLIVPCVICGSGWKYKWNWTFFFSSSDINLHICKLLTHYVDVHFRAGRVNIGVLLRVKLGKGRAYMQIISI